MVASGVAMLRRAATVALAFTALAAPAACGSKGFDEKTCAQYNSVFVTSCTETCSRSLDRTTCASKCAEALPKDPTYASKCLATAASASK